MKLKTANIIGLPLDWAVATALGHKELYKADYGRLFKPSDFGISKLGYRRIEPSTDWAQGGPIVGILINEGFIIQKTDYDLWYKCFKVGDDGPYYYGPTPLITAMRCFCCARLGYEIDIPEEIL